MSELAERNTEFFQPYLDSVFVISHSQRTVKVYAAGLRHLEKLILQNHQCGLDALVSKIKLGELDIYKVLRDFVVYLDKSGAKPASIKTWVASVKGFFRHYGIRIYSEDFKQVIRMPKQIHYREEPITKEILVRLLHNITPRIQTVILVAVASGMRIGEIVQLRISDIDFASKPVKIRIRAEIAKGKMSRETFLTSEATSALKDHLKKMRGWDETNPNKRENMLIFGSASNKKPDTKVTTDSLANSLKKFCLNIPELTKVNENGRYAIHFHAFRKYFRTVVGNAVGRDFAEALMGHRFYLDTYYQLSEDKKREMYLKAEPYLTISDFTDIEKKLTETMEKQKELENNQAIFMKIITERFQVPPELLKGF